MMKVVAKQGLAMLATEKPHTAVTAWIDTLCLPKYDEDDYEGLAELVESINLQATGPTEASRAIRKKLKYSNIHGQVRALTILKVLVENGGTRFQTTFANERLVDRIKLMAGDPVLDQRVKTKIMDVLGSWHRQFKDDPRMQLVAGLYISCGGGKKAPTRTAATEAYENQQARYEREAAERAERKAKERSALAEREQRDREAREAKAMKKKATVAPKTKRAPFNFEAEKPKIMSSVGSAAQAAQSLINALQLVNREQESVTTNERVIECLNRAKSDRKAIVRYIQLVDNDPSGEYIGTLLATNEQVLTALSLYDRMSKPVELDSDDEAIEEAKKRATQQGLKVRDHDGDTDSIRSRLSAFEIQDGEVDKLQMRQRARVEKVNRARTVHPDLADLAFGPTGGSSLPPPIQPHSADDDSIDHGSLSEFSDGSDYSTSDGEVYPPHRGPPPTSASASASQALPNVSARSYAQYIQEDDARTGKGRALLDEEDDDPFADPVDDGASSYSIPTPGITERRMEWREAPSPILSSSLPTAFLPRLPRALSAFHSPDPAADLLALVARLRDTYEPAAHKGRHPSGAEDSGYASENEEELEIPAHDVFELTWAKQWLLNLNRRVEAWIEELSDDGDDGGAGSEQREQERERRLRLIDESAQVLARLSETSEPGAMIRPVVLPTAVPDRPVLVTLYDALPSATDATSVGLQSWGSSILLSRMLALDPAAFGSRSRGRRTLELGAGTGLLSLVWKVLSERFVADDDALSRAIIGEDNSSVPPAQSGRPHEIIATDFHADVLANLRKNVLSNSAPSPDGDGRTCAELKVHKLDWEAVHLSRIFASKSTGSSLAMPAPFHAAFDTIFAADVVYAPAHALWLRSCVEHFLARPPTPPSPFFVSPLPTPLSSPSLAPFNPDEAEPAFHLLVPIRPTHALAIATISEVFPLAANLPENRLEGDWRLAIKSVKELPRVRGIGRADETSYRLYRIGWA